MGFKVTSLLLASSSVSTLCVQFAPVVTYPSSSGKFEQFGNPLRSIPVYIEEEYYI